jgi:hypothetical protein
MIRLGSGMGGHVPAYKVQFEAFSFQRESNSTWQMYWRTKLGSSEQHGKLRLK